jgi:hypothetical protein
MHPLAHMLTGALIGQLAPTPVTALVGGLLSHFVLEAIPHAEGATFGARSDSGPGVELIEAGLEFIAGAVIVGWIAGSCPAARPLSIALATLAALVPDLIDQPLHRLRGATLLHLHSLHWTVTRRHALWGILTQVAVAGIAGLLLWRATGCA